MKNLICSLANWFQFVKLNLAFFIAATFFCETVFSQDTIKPVDFSSQMKLEKYFTIHHPGALAVSTLKMKSRDGKIYLLNDNFISGKELLLFTMDLQTNLCDTNYILIDEYAINISDFDVCSDRL